MFTDIFQKIRNRSKDVFVLVRDNWEYSGCRLRLYEYFEVYLNICVVNNRASEKCSSPVHNLYQRNATYMHCTFIYFSFLGLFLYILKRV